MTGPDRAQRLRDEVARLRAKTDAGTVEKRLARLGAALMALGALTCAGAYLLSAAQLQLGDQIESVILAVGGAGLIVAGAALFLRYSLSRFLRAWMLRLIYEFQSHPGGGDPGGDPGGGDPGGDPGGGDPGGDPGGGDPGGDPGGGDPQFDTVSEPGATAGVAPVDLTERLDADHVAGLASIPVDGIDLTDIGRARRTLATLPARPVPEGVAVEDRVAASAGGAGVGLRLYSRRDGPVVPAAVVWMHGGGMVMGSVAMSDAYCGWVARELGVLVVSVDYRLAPEHPYPAPLEDCYHALVWTAQNCEGLGVDPGRVAVGGYSAGGGLAAGVALAARDRRGPAIALQLLAAPMLDDRNITASSHRITDPRVWNRRSNLLAWAAYLEGRAGTGAVSAYAAPARARDLAGVAPAHLAVGEFDLFVDETVAYARALTAAGVSSELHVYAGAFHGSDRVVPHSEASKRWRADELATLRRALTCE